MEKITIAEILRGTEPRINPQNGMVALQSVGFMQIIPLVSELTDDRFIAPDNAVISTHDYGTLIVKNDSGKRGQVQDTMILPFGAGYVTQKAAQDHATPTVKMIKPKSGVTINTAACIQQNQGGTIPGANYPFTIIPWAIKEQALKTRKETSYSKLWESIGEFNKSLGLTTNGHLEHFLKGFKDELDDFIAQFEIVPKQVGAIILINGNVVGVERAPNYNFWRSIWGPLIRECYGSLAMQYAKQNKEPQIPKTRKPVDPRSITSLDQLDKAFKKAAKQENDASLEVIKKLVSDEFNRSHEENIDGFDIETIEHKQFMGQIIRSDETIVYASIVTTSSWTRNQKWFEAEKFKI